MKKLAIVFSLSTLLLLAAGCGADTGQSTGRVIASAPAGNNLTVELSNESGVLRRGEGEFYLTFKNAAGNPTDVGAVALNFHMPAMGTMPVMNNPATFTTTGRPGVYRGRANIEMAGEWQTQITYEGPAGQGRATFAVTAQ